MTQYLAVFKGANYPAGSIFEESHVEVWWNLEHAKRSLAERHSTGAWYALDIRRLNNQVQSILMPAVEVGDELHLWIVDEDMTFREAWTALTAPHTDPYPDYILRVGPRGGVQKIKP